MASVIGRKKPLLLLSLSEVWSLMRYVRRAREKEEMQMKAMEESIATTGDLVEISGHTYRRSEWILKSRDKIAEMDEIIDSLNEYEYRLYARGGW